MKAMGNPAAAIAPQNNDFPGMVVKSEGGRRHMVSSRIVLAQVSPRSLFTLVR